MTAFLPQSLILKQAGGDICIGPYSFQTEQILLVHSHFFLKETKQKQAVYTSYRRILSTVMRYRMEILVKEETAQRTQRGERKGGHRFDLKPHVRYVAREGEWHVRRES